MPCYQDPNEVKYYRDIEKLCRFCKTLFPGLLKESGLFNWYVKHLRDDLENGSDEVAIKAKQELIRIQGSVDAKMFGHIANQFERSRAQKAEIIFELPEKYTKTDK